MLQVKRKPFHSLSATTKLQKVVTVGKPSSNGNGSRQVKVPEIINGASRQVIISRVCPEKTTKKPQVSIPLIELD